MPSTSIPAESWLGALGDSFDRRVNDTLIGETQPGVNDASSQTDVVAAMLVIEIDNFSDLQILDAAQHVRGLVSCAGQRIQTIVDPFNGFWVPAAQNQLRVFLPNVAREDLGALSIHLRSALSAAFTFSGKALLVTFNVAVAVCPEHGNSAQILTRHAQLAMQGLSDSRVSAYRLFDANTVSAAQSARALEQDLRQLMLDRDTSQFELAYQRLSRCADGACIGGEALLRWHHPKLGVVPTEGMIIMAERAGLIVEVGNWVLEQACRQASAWPAHWKVHVNVSVEQLRQPDFVTKVTQTLASSGLPAARLGIEITETLHIPHYESLAEQLTALQAVGVSIVLDDFGSGYSSLNHLRSLPLDCIKLDALFSADLETNARARAVIKALVQLAHALALEVVAEGVETMAQHEVLCDLGCDTMQGYLLGRPMSSADLLASDGGHA